MKSRTKKVVNTSGPEKVAYILPQGQLDPGKTRKSGRPVRTKCYNPSGFVLVGMYESLGKTFTTHEAAAKYAEEHGFKVKTNRPLRNPRVAAAAVVAACLLASME